VNQSNSESMNECVGAYLTRELIRHKCQSSITSTLYLTNKY